MAAANASPVHRSRTNGQAQQRIQTVSGDNTSSGQHRGSPSRHQIQAGGNNWTLRYDLEDLDMYSPNRTHNPDQQTLQNNHQISHRNLANSSPIDEKYEIHHLRTKLEGLGVLQEVLSDKRVENQELQDCWELVVNGMEDKGIVLDQVLHEKLDRVRVGSVTLPDNQWSVELKRPPVSSSMLTQVDGRDQNSRLKEQLKAKDIRIQMLETKIIELRDQLQSSSDEKSQEIARLQAQLQAFKDLCQSLKGEAEFLRHKLSQHCNVLASELTDFKKNKFPGGQVLELQCQVYEEIMKKLQRQLQEYEDCQRHRRIDQTEAAHKDDRIRRLQKEVIDLEQEIRKARRDSIKYDKEVVMQQGENLRLGDFEGDTKKAYNPPTQPSGIHRYEFILYR